MKKKEKKNIRMYSSPAYTGNAIREIGRAEERRAQAKKDKVRLIRDIIIAIIVGVLIGTFVDRRQPSTTKEVGNESNLSNSESYSSSSSWHEASARYDLSSGSSLTYNGVLFYNFDAYATKGFDIATNSIASGVGDYGFTVSISNPDTASIAFYNNTSEDIVPLEVTIEFPENNIYYSCDELDDWNHEVSGYSSCVDGFGLVTVNYSTNVTLALGVYKQGDQLYAFDMNNAK